MVSAKPKLEVPDEFQHITMRIMRYGRFGAKQQTNCKSVKLL